MDQLFDKLDKLPQIEKMMQRRAGRPRAWRKMLSVAPMQSARVIREITASMMPEKIKPGEII